MMRSDEAEGPGKSEPLRLLKMGEAAQKVVQAEAARKQGEVGKREGDEERG